MHVQFEWTLRICASNPMFRHIAVSPLEAKFGVILRAWLPSFGEVTVNQTTKPDQPFCCVHEGMLSRVHPRLLAEGSYLSQ